MINTDATVILNRIDLRLDSIELKIVQQDSPSMESMYELMTARLILTNMCDEESLIPLCQKSIDRIDRLITCFENSLGMNVENQQSK